MQKLLSSSIALLFLAGLPSVAFAEADTVSDDLQEVVVEETEDEDTNETVDENETGNERDKSVESGPGLSGIAAAIARECKDTTGLDRVLCSLRMRQMRKNAQLDRRQERINQRIEEQKERQKALIESLKEKRNTIRERRTEVKKFIQERSRVVRERKKAITRQKEAYKSVVQKTRDERKEYLLQRQEALTVKSQQVKTRVRQSVRQSTHVRFSKRHIFELKEEVDAQRTNVRESAN